MINMISRYGTSISIRKYSDPGWVQLIVYTGAYPSLVYKDYNLSEKDGQKIKGKILNKDIDWLLFDISSEGFIVKEQKISCNSIGKDMIVHIAIMSDQETIIDELTKIAENIKLE